MCGRLLVWWAGAGAQDPREDSGAVRSRCGEGVFALLRSTSTRKRGLCPVALHAMEAAFFYAMQESLGVTDFRRLGGWVYTSSKPSPLDVMRLTQAHRQLRNTCFDCGQGALCEAQDMPWVQLGLLVQVCGMLGEEQCFQPGPKYIARTCHTTSATISSESNTTTAHSRSCSGGEGEWCASSLSKEVRRISLQPRSRAFIFRAVLGVR